MDSDEARKAGSARADLRAKGALLLSCLLGLVVAAGCERQESADADAAARSAETSGTVHAFIQDGTAAAPGDEFAAGGTSTDEGARATGGSTASEAGALQGRFRGNFIVALYSEEGGFWVDIGRRAEMEMNLRDPRPAALVESVGDVPPGTYNRIRVLVCHSSAEVEPGSRIGDRTVEARSSVHLTETGDVIVEREVEPFEVGPRSPIEVGIDLNSERWLTEEAVASDTASIPAFEREVTVSVRRASE